MNFIFQTPKYTLNDIEKNLEFKPPLELVISPKIEAKYLASVQEFLNVVKKNPAFDLTNLYRNIKTLSIRPSIMNFLLGNQASYVNDTNVIETEYKNYLKGIYHELFHVLSTIHTQDVLFSGFSIYVFQKKLDIGNGLNEGYTELLNQRYFKNSEDTQADPYYLEVFFVKNLELIIGRHQMEYLYSKSSLYGLVLELKKYNTDTQIIKFINNMDKLLKYDKFDNRYFKTKDIAKNLICELTNFLIQSYAQKLSLKYLNNEISLELYQSKVNNYLKSLAKYLNYDADTLLKEPISNFNLKLRKTY